MPLDFPDIGRFRPIRSLLTKNVVPRPHSFPADRHQGARLRTRRLKNGDHAVSASFVIDTQTSTETLNQDAFDLTGSSDTLLVTSAGSLLALDGGNGITASGGSETIMLDGLAYSSSATGVALGSANTLFVGGQVEGYNGVTAANNDHITVNGTVEGANVGVSLTAQFTSLIADGAVQGGAAGILVDDSSDNSINIGAQGSVSSAVSGVLMDYAADDNTLTNDGHITSAGSAAYVYSSGWDTIINDGTISSSGESGADAAITFYTANASAIQNSGLIAGVTAIDLAEGSSATLSSSGTIDGVVNVSGGSTATISNAGTVEGGLAVSDTSQADIENTGIWQGALDFGSSANNILTNSGKIHGAVTMGTGSDTVTNTGTITGAVAFSGTDDTLTNGGLIHGPVAMGTGDILINSGAIHGSVVLGTGDTLDTSHGEITGTVKAAASDMFDFSGSFGHNTILGFAWSGATHDTIHFQSDDFANYAAVQAHMAQVGSDVVITLDAGDTIVLENMALAHLVSHDFTFG